VLTSTDIDIAGFKILEKGMTRASFQRRKGLVLTPSPDTTTAGGRRSAKDSATRAAAGTGTTSTPEVSAKGSVPRATQGLAVMDVDVSADALTTTMLTTATPVVKATGIPMTTPTMTTDEAVLADTDPTTNKIQGVPSPCKYTTKHSGDMKLEFLIY
jgi:hypothetical protein